MGTRGLMGFAIDSKLKLAYNHFDSYPSGLGVDMLTFARTISEDDWKLKPVIQEQARNLRLVDSTSPPTAQQIEQLTPYADRRVGGRSLDEWYVLLRETQGDPAKTLESGYMENGDGFQYDSLFCEWGYILDLDWDILEVYRGFQKEPHTEGRFAAGPVRLRKPVGENNTREPIEYQPIKLVAKFRFEDLPTDEEFCAKVDPSEEDE